MNILQSYNHKLIFFFFKNSIKINKKNDLFVFLKKYKSIDKYPLHKEIFQLIFHFFGNVDKDFDV